MFAESAFSMAALRLAMAPQAEIATFFGIHRGRLWPPVIVVLVAVGYGRGQGS